MPLMRDFIEVLNNRERISVMSLMSLHSQFSDVRGKRVVHFCGFIKAAKYVLSQRIFVSFTRTQ